MPAQVRDFFASDAYSSGLTARSSQSSANQTSVPHSAPMMIIPAHHQYRPSICRKIRRYRRSLLMIAVRIDHRRSPDQSRLAMAKSCLRERCLATGGSFSRHRGALIPAERRYRSTGVMSAAGGSLPKGPDRRGWKRQRPRLHKAGLFAPYQKGREKVRRQLRFGRTSGGFTESSRRNY